MQSIAFPTEKEPTIGAPADRLGIQPPEIALKRWTVPTFEFSTSNLPPADQFAAWRSSYATMVDLSGPDDCTAGFAGDQVIWDLGSLAVSHVRTAGLRFSSLAGHVRRDPLDHWLISVMLEGNSRTVASSHVFDGHAGSVQIHPLGRVFEGHLTNSGMLQLFVPRDFCRGMAHVLEAAEFSTLEGGMARLFADYMASLVRCLPLLDAVDLPGLVSSTRAMILACIARSPDHLEEAGDSIANALLERARRFIEANIVAPDLGATSLQRELGISRSRLYRLFEPYGGVNHYIQHRRLLDTYARLADPNDRRRILEIAEERGFNDAAEFSRAFRREFGYSPSEVRAAGKTGWPDRAAIDLNTVAPVDRLGALLHRLQA
jgi:AraC-like DNA-binding protein